MAQRLQILNSETKGFCVSAAAEFRKGRRNDRSVLAYEKAIPTLRRIRQTLLSMKANPPVITLAASIVIAALIYACSTRYEPVTEHSEYDITYQYAFDRWSGNFTKKRTIGLAGRDGLYRELWRRLPGR